MVGMKKTGGAAPPKSNAYQLWYQADQEGQYMAAAPISPALLLYPSIRNIRSTCIKMSVRA